MLAPWLGWLEKGAGTCATAIGSTVITVRQASCFLLPFALFSCAVWCLFQSASLSGSSEEAADALAQPAAIALLPRAMQCCLQPMHLDSTSFGKLSHAVVPFHTNLKPFAAAKTAMRLMQPVRQSSLSRKAVAAKALDDAAMQGVLSDATVRQSVEEVVRKTVDLQVEQRMQMVGDVQSRDVSVTGVLREDPSLKPMLDEVSSVVTKYFQDPEFVHKVSTRLRDTSAPNEERQKPIVSPEMQRQVQSAATMHDKKMAKCSNLAVAVAEAARDLLPQRVILVRHGESEANVDKTFWNRKPDNLIELSEKGRTQARAAGERIRRLIGNESVAFFVSPFERSLQTFRNVELAFPDGQISRAVVEPRIREQEFGNTQGKQFKTYRLEQRTVGRFWYRFPTGESGSDVYDRTTQWWDSTLMTYNSRPGCDHVDNVVVITHGLTMRFILMQLFGWSPNTFHTVWNADNCDMYVLKKNLTLKGHDPYQLSEEEGDMPRSSIRLILELDSGERRRIQLDDWLSIPPPRTVQRTLVKEKIREQHGIDPSTIVSIDFFDGKFTGSAVRRRRTSRRIVELKLNKDVDWDGQPKKSRYRR
eukprot:gnl/TRDRNA2_/TRDRNA2_164513_c0_seq5.p1 gnl/TRDRNA2_/TRDRNA2_164513_c0~~gnl/TRDRNA2_/TRDRNA2_164513_c0_seq5.p1  ORF type:complete len:588 (-),score=78.22 gnl/TRDRNA2_/TRDRNA2_164513_c0_seq5:463-2226(-)